MAHFDLPLDLSHAGNIVDRMTHVLMRRLRAKQVIAPRVMETQGELVALLAPFCELPDNGPQDEARQVRDRAAELVRGLVDEVERLGIGDDRLGQLVRNLFECLALGQEGAWQSLRAGESPDSLQRPI